MSSLAFALDGNHGSITSSQAFRHGTGRNAPAPLLAVADMARTTRACARDDRSNRASRPRRRACLPGSSALQLPARACMPQQGRVALPEAERDRLNSARRRSCPGSRHTLPRSTPAPGCSLLQTRGVACSDWHALGHGCVTRHPPSAAEQQRTSSPSQRWPLCWLRRCRARPACDTPDRAAPRRPCHRSTSRTGLPLRSVARASLAPTRDCT